MKVSILVPRREGFEDRDRLWAWCRPWWQQRHPDWPLIEGHHTHGLFNRSAALNQAAALAGDWDVAVVIDSDVVIDPDAVHEAVTQAHAQGQMAVPFTTRMDLSQHGTALVMAGHTPSESLVRRRYTDQHSTVVAISRRLWDDVGGFDEGFSGWGLEDTAFALACETLTGAPLLRTSDGVAWHLFHATNKAEKHGSMSHHRNMARAAHYRAAHAQGDKARIRELVVEGREMEAARQADSIPRILHRVVPERSPAVAEQWWQRFADLHPGWRLMTHRDPLDAAEWPLTSPHWRKAANGAQLADLVRLEALLRWGGFYVDQDVEPFRPLDPFLGAEVVAAWEDANVIPNAVLGARPDHPLIRRCLELAIARMRISTWEAGPGVTTRVLRDAPGALLLPPGAFYPVHYRDPERDVKMTQKPEPWTVARHAYWGSWLPEERRRVPAA